MAPWSRRAPMRCKAKKFTNGADKEDIVLPENAKTFSAVIANAEALGLVGMGFGDEQALLSGEAAEVCDYLEFPLRCMAGAGVAPWSRCAPMRLQGEEVHKRCRQGGYRAPEVCEDLLRSHR